MFHSVCEVSGYQDQIFSLPSYGATGSYLRGRGSLYQLYASRDGQQLTGGGTTIETVSIDKLKRIIFRNKPLPNLSIGDIFDILFLQYPGPAFKNL